MLETHPYPPFVPADAKYLLLGSFVAKKYDGDVNYDWYYGAKRNQFWRILERVYERKFPDREAKAQLFNDLKLAVTDIIYQAQRRDGTSLDANLINVVYNTPAIERILHEYKIIKIFFTSRYVEKGFRKLFKSFAVDYPQIELVTLPSPSPRYALLSLEAKIQRYKELFPSL